MSCHVISSCRIVSFGVVSYRRVVSCHVVSCRVISSCHVCCGWNLKIYLNHSKCFVWNLKLYLNCSKVLCQKFEILPRIAEKCCAVNLKFNLNRSKPENTQRNCKLENLPDAPKTVMLKIWIFTWIAQKLCVGNYKVYLNHPKYCVGNWKFFHGSQKSIVFEILLQSPKSVMLKNWNYIRITQKRCVENLKFLIAQKCCVGNVNFLKSVVYEILSESLKSVCFRTLKF